MASEARCRLPVGGPRGRVRMSTVVAVGVFDGLHLGHRALLERARALAGDGRCVAVSFDPHPDVVLAREFKPMPPLTPIPEKHELLGAMGIELHVIAFTREIAALSPEAFVEAHLVRPLVPSALVVGEDFALGRARAGDVTRLGEIGSQHGFTVSSVPLMSVGGATVSSTRIRSLLNEGDVAGAARLLGRFHSLTGLVVRGEGLGRELGFPTANLRLLEEKVIPGHGIYAVHVRLAGTPDWLQGAMSIGVRPTFGGQVRTLEVFILDYSGDLYGSMLEVRLVGFLRPELRFDGAEALVVQMAVDVERTRQVLAGSDAGAAIP